jgi:hypothetical protein
MTLSTPKLPYLTKSKFRLALECATKLYYANNKSAYHDQNQEDSFLQALAEGGFQVGELAKFLFSEDPVGERITIDSLDYETALQETQQKREAGGRVVIAEAAFRFEHCFIRADIIVEEGKTIHLYEVKAKCWEEGDSLLKANKSGEVSGLQGNWMMYLYDLAFQKWVIQRANPTKRVKAHLVLADKDQQTTLDGLNQRFRIIKENGRPRVFMPEGLKRQDLGQIPLTVQAADEACDYIFQHDVPTDLETPYGFEAFIALLVKKMSRNDRIWAPIGSKCKGCQFNNPEYPNGLKSGFHECWQNAGISLKDLQKPLVLDIWSGKAGAISVVQELINQGKYRISQVKPGDRSFHTEEVEDGCTLDAKQRRLLQVRKAQKQDYTPHLDRDGLKALFDTLPPPYHFIDFETSMVALPFHKGRRPYEAIAFQYSYHRMEEDGRIAHTGQYISFDRGAFPNYDFIRALRADLGDKPGTIFRYHSHENTYLNHIYRQLQDENNFPDREELMDFIRRIANPTGSLKGQWEATQPMEDLYELVLNHFYSLHAGGSNSIKDILPAVIRSSEFLRHKYGQPIYATEQIPSLNFREPHAWIREDKGYNPYQTLPSLPEAAEHVQLELNDSSLNELKDGGAAMVAYAKLQFSDIPKEERALYRDALLRYCELDTMAMVMIWEYWGKEIGRW